LYVAVEYADPSQRSQFCGTSSSTLAMMHPGGTLFIREAIARVSIHAYMLYM
jgi:hypothetical protein